MPEKLIRFIFLPQSSAVHKHYTCRYLPGKSHLMVTTTIVIFSSAKSRITLKTSPTTLRVQSRCRFIKQHHIRFHTKRPDYRNTLLLPAGKLVRIGRSPVLEPDGSRSFIASASSFSLSFPEASSAPASDSRGLSYEEIN